MKSRNNPRFGRIGLSLAGLALFVWACHLTQEPEKETVLSLGALADSLTRYDSVQILLKSPSGLVLDKVYSGPVTGREDLIDRPVPHYDGGKAVITIIAYEDGKVVQQVDRIYDGKTGKVDSVKAIILAESALEIGPRTATLLVGEEAALPAVTVTPDHLADKTVLWSSTEPLIVKILDGRFEGVSAGTAELTARLKSDESKSASFSVWVNDNPAGNPPDSLRLQPDTLMVAVKGGSRKFALTVVPASAGKDVTWHSADTLKARISDAGEVEGLAPGTVKVWVVSKADVKVTDTAWVEVKEEIKVTKVDLLKETLEVVAGGTREALEVAVEPSLADPTVDFTVRDGTKAKVVDGKVEGLAEGETWIVASSRRDASKRDSVRVVVTGRQVVDSVVVDKDNLRLFTGGESLALSAAVHPAKTSQAVQWISSDPDIAAVDTQGKVSPVGPGTTYVRAVSRQDSLKMDSAKVTVKRDFPILSINDQDTTVSAGSTVVFDPKEKQKQEYGVVTRFEWDLDGDGTLDGTSDTLKPVSFRYAEAREYSALFRVRDSEGNKTEVIKKVKAVNGPVILIKTPANNSYSNKTVIGISWSVDGVDQTGGITETLIKEGANTVTREAKDAVGKVYSASITVFLDSVPPAKPSVQSAATPTNSRTPIWTWSTGGLGGNGTYRFRLDTAIAASTPALADTVFQPSAPLSEGAHVLHVQERDAAGNWSATGSFIVVVDTTPPAAPVVTSASALINTHRPSWTWMPGGPGGSRIFRSRVDAADLSDAVPSPDTAFTPSADLPEGSHVLYAQERDAAGNWSASGSFTVRIDRTPPALPVFAANMLSPLNTLRPSWSWSSGGNGGMGKYRARVDDQNLFEETPFTATFYTSPSDLSEGAHTLYLQERDSAGNWSPIASQALRLAMRDTVGKRGLSGGTSSMDFAMSPQGVPHFVFTDSMNSQKASVMSFNGGLWSYVGNPGFSSGTAWKPRIAFDRNGAPFVVFQDGSNSYRPTVMAYKGGAWVMQGANILANAPQIAAIAVSPAGTPFVAYSTSNSMRVDSLGSSWTSTGSPSIAPHLDVPFSMAFSADGSLYLAYSAGGVAIPGRPVVQRYAGGVWQVAGTGLPADAITSISLAMNGASPQVATAALGKLSVHALSGSAWTPMGTTGFAFGQTVSLSVNAAGTPVVAFPDGNNILKVAVRILNNGGWVSMSANGLSIGAGANVQIAVQQASGVPYVAFTEPANGRKVTVMKTAFDPP